MTAIEKNKIDAYTVLLEHLSVSAKKELISRLKDSIKVKKKPLKNGLEKSFGAWESDKSAEEIIKEIKESQNFRNREINL